MLRLHKKPFNILLSYIYIYIYICGEWDGYQPIYGLTDLLFLNDGCILLFLGVMFKVNFQIIYSQLISIMCGMVVAETYISWDIE